MIRAIIIDDEKLARSLLRGFLQEMEAVEIIAEFENGFEGLKGITNLKPDLVFLDIKMPKLNGFEMLELLGEIPHVIFVTAYDQYAVKAFENNAVDYLLKPFSEDRLRAAVSKVRELIDNETHKSNGIQALIEDHDRQLESIDRIAVKTGNRIKIIYVEEVQYLEAQDDYVMIYTENGKYLKQKTMKYFERSLPSQSFLRVHRSYLVRMDFVSQIELYEKDSYIIKLKNGQRIPVSKSGYSRLRSALNF